ncbi:MAG: thiamine pyrophosphate-binding protein [Desulfobacterales bacterium]
MPKIADRILASLKSNGVTTVFGIPSIHNIGFYDALRRDGSVRHILCRHEGSAVHMADGYARSGAGVGVVIASTGPGAAYTLSPLIEAFYSCSPVLIISSNVRTSQMGKNTGVLHEFRHQESAFKSVTKCRCCLRPDVNVAERVNRVILTARSGRPGPAYLEVPYDMWDMEAGTGAGTVQDFSPKPRSESDLDAVVERIEKAKRPLIIAGIEAVHAGMASEVTELAVMLDAPVLTDAGGKGIIREDNRLSFGNVTNGGVVKEIHQCCDVTLSIGSRLRYVDFKRRGVVLPGLIHMDWDRQWIDKNFRADIGLVGDVSEMLGSLKRRLGRAIPPERKAFVDRMNAKRERVLEKTPGISPETTYLDAVRRAIPDSGILVVDNTILGYFAEQLYPSFRPLGLVPAKGASPIGFAFPAAAGLKIACPDIPVAALIGDGGFLYGSQELSTCVANRVGFPVIVVNDGAYRMIDFLQNTHYKAGYETALFNPDFKSLAAAYGIGAACVDSPEQLHDAVADALDSGRMRLIELKTTFPDPPFGRF